jgi:hypothetical protein
MYPSQGVVGPRRCLFLGEFDDRQLADTVRLLATAPVLRSSETRPGSIGVSVCSVGPPRLTPHRMRAPPCDSPSTLSLPRSGINLPRSRSPGRRGTTSSCCSASGEPLPCWAPRSSASASCSPPCCLPSMSATVVTGCRAVDPPTPQAAWSRNRFPSLRTRPRGTRTTSRCLPLFDLRGAARLPRGRPAARRSAPDR